MDFMGIFKNVWTDFDGLLWVIEIDGNRWNRSYRVLVIL
jgi:hypothetical protein